jgi:hypothetical protein
MHHPDANHMSDTATDYGECPHCYITAMFYADGTCPSCRKSRFDLRNVDSSRTQVCVELQHQLPPCCFLCGEQTERTQRLGWTFDRYRISQFPPTI